MRFKAIVLAVCLAAASMASQTGVKFERKYKVGDKDTYVMTMQTNVQGMAIDMKMTLVQTVKKVYDNGDADLETAPSSMMVNGSEIPQKQRPETMRVSKLGVPTEAGAKGMTTMMSYSSLIGDKEFKVGETYPINTTDAKNPDMKVVGTVKVDSIENGVAKLTSKLDISQKSSAKPMHMESITLIDMNSGKANRVDGTATGLAMGGGPLVESAKFTFERKM